MKAIETLGKQRCHIESIDDERKEVSYHYAKALRQAFREEADVLFEDHPDLECFSWSQCSVECNAYEFFVDRMAVSVNGNNDQQRQPNAMTTDVAEFLEIFDDDDFRSLFGDHVKITVTEQGIDVAFHDGF